MSHPFTLTPRSIVVNIPDIPRYMEFLEEYLGVEEVNQRLKKINRAIKIESGTYLHYWLLPNSIFWLGLEEARQLSANKTRYNKRPQSLERTIEIAAKLQALDYSMSPRVRNDLRARILNNEDLSPIFFEIDTAAHFWQLGYDVEWAEPVDKPRSRIPEFTLTNGKNKVEVECKSKQADAGRKISRPNFYRLVDEIAAPLSAAGYTGKVRIIVRDRMPIKDSWKKQVDKAIGQLLSSKTLQIQLGDGTDITIDLHKLGGITIPAENIIAEAQKNKYPYSYLAIFAKEYSKSSVNPLIFELKSQTNDHFLQGIFENLKDANHQFTGDNASIICCFVPEVDSFAGLQQDSELFNMTKVFFKKHAKPFLLAVSYSSNSITTPSFVDIIKSSPAIRIDNPDYDEKFGPRISTFE